MYTPQQQWGPGIDNPILIEQLAYDPVEMAEGRGQLSQVQSRAEGGI